MHHNLTLQIPGFPFIADDFDVYSESISAGGYNWRLRAYRDLLVNEDHLGAFLECDNDAQNAWSVRANFEIRVKNHIDDAAEANAKYTYIFFSHATLPAAGNNYGEPMLIKIEVGGEWRSHF